MPIIHRNSDYSIRSLVELARERDVVPVSKLAEACDVPVDFLRKIMQTLKGAGLVHSVQGPAGGYGLRVDPDEITLWEVLTAVQGPVVVNECFENADICCNIPNCPVRSKLSELQDKVTEWLKGLTVGDLVEHAESAAL